MAELENELQYHLLGASTDEVANAEIRRLKHYKLQHHNRIISVP
jgi:hypothetical protein